MPTRRGIIAGGAGLLLAGCVDGPVAAAPDVLEKFAAIEARIGGRLGVCAIDTGSGASIGHRQDERFAMASTFKWILAAAILQRCESGLMPLDATMYYTPSDLLPNSPVTQANIDAIKGIGALTLEQLCEAVVTVSDNCGANLLFVPMFGPEGVTGFVRASGDAITRLDRRETELNENAANDPRDTTTPGAMAHTLQRFLTTDEVLNAASRQKLIGWLEKTSTGLDRLRAGIPQGWRVGDKTGAGGNGAHNDLAIVFPPGRKPIVIASYMDRATVEDDQRAAAHADVARIVVAGFA